MATQTQSHQKGFITIAHIVKKHTTQAKARQISTNYFVVKNAKMSKATINTIKRANKRLLQTKLDRAIETYGKRNGGLMFAVHEFACNNHLPFSERLETSMEIIELNK